MANEFITRNGLISLSNATITGSLNVSGGGNFTSPLIAYGGGGTQGGGVRSSVNGSYFTATNVFSLTAYNPDKAYYGWDFQGATPPSGSSNYVVGISLPLSYGGQMMLGNSTSTGTIPIVAGGNQPYQYLTNSALSDNGTSYILSGRSLIVSGNTSITGSLNVSGSATANSFIKSGGTSSQFLKADGSVDSSTYLTTGNASSTYLPLSGGTLTGALTGSSATFSSTVTANSFSGAGTGLTGTASSLTVGNSTQWNGQNLNTGTNYTSPLYFMTTTGAPNWGYSTVANVQSALGLGSNAYSSTAYLPLSGGTLTGALTVNSGNSLISTGNFGLYAASAYYIRLGNTSTYSFGMYIPQSTGNVVIGSETDNGSKLQVNGSSTFSGAMNIAYGYSSLVGGQILVEDGNGNGEIRIYSPTGTSPNTQIWALRNNRTSFSLAHANVNRGSDVASSFTDLFVLTNSGNATFAGGISTSANVTAATGAGQSFFIGHQLGGGYSMTGTGIFQAISDNPTGTSNIFFQGIVGGSGGTTTFSVRADGQIASLAGASFAGGITANSLNIGSGGSSLFGVQDISVSNAKATATTTSAFFIKTNDSSNPFSLRFQITGASSLSNRYVSLQTTDISLADGGNLTLQNAAGNVIIGTTTDNGSKLQVNGTISTNGNTIIGKTEASTDNSTKSASTAFVNNISPVQVAKGNLSGQTATGTVCTYVVGASDTNFLISAYLGITTSLSNSIIVQVSYNDETNTARTINLYRGIVSTVTYTSSAVGSYPLMPQEILAKAGSTITIQTTNSISSGVFNIVGRILQLP